MASNCSGQRVLNLELTIPRSGAWRCDVEVDSAAAISGATVIDIDGQQWSGTVLDSHAYAGRTRALVVGGAGGMDREIEARQYVGAKLDSILHDTLREGGERLSSTIASSVLSRNITQWERISGTIGDAIGLLASEQSLSLRVLRDGTVWLGEETWGAIEPEVVIIDEDWVNGSVTLAPADDFADVVGILPGLTYAGRRIEQVVHIQSESQLRTIVQTVSAQSELSRLFEPIRNAITYSREWLCEVVAQNGDGTLQVKPASSAISGRGLNRVRIMLGVPGTVTVPDGASVLVRFVDGDPRQPCAVAFGGSALTQLKLGSGADFVALAAKVDKGFEDLQTWLNAHTHPTGVGPSGPPASPYSKPASVAAAKTKAE